MPQEPMKFCASLNRCRHAVAIGKPGRVQIALDRAPLDEGKLNKMMAFLADKLSPGDFEQFQDLVDDVVDDAEEANPSAQMAEDGYSTSTRRTIRRAHRNIALGQDRQATGRPGASPRVARDEEGFASRFPEAAKIKTDLSWSGNPAPASRQPRVAMDSAQSESFDERYGTGRIRHAG